MDFVPQAHIPSRTPVANSLATLAGFAVLAALVSAIATAHVSAADDKPPQPVAQRNLAVFLTLDGTITDSVTAGVRRAALDLQSKALQEQKQAFLVLELSPGISEFHHVYLRKR